MDLAKHLLCRAFPELTHQALPSPFSPPRVCLTVRVQVHFAHFWGLDVQNNTPRGEPAALFPWKPRLTAVPSGANGH